MKRELPLRLQLRLSLNRILRDVYLPVLTSILPLSVPRLIILFDEVSQSQKTIAAKIQEANHSMNGTMDLINELQSLLEEKTKELDVLKTEYDKYSKLAGIKKKKAKLVMDQVEESLDKRKGSERLIGFAISVIAGLIVFFLGILLSPYVRSILGIP